LSCFAAHSGQNLALVTRLRLEFEPIADLNVPGGGCFSGPSRSKPIIVTSPALCSADVVRAAQQSSALDINPQKHRCNRSIPQKKESDASLGLRLHSTALLSGSSGSRDPMTRSKISFALALSAATLLSGTAISQSQVDPARIEAERQARAQREAAEAAERAKRELAASKDAEARAQAKQDRDAAEAAERAKNQNKDRR
jgi:hypothetical protein